jgi:hypothetical protein
MATINTLVITPFMDMIMKVASFIPTLVSALVLMVIGLFLAKVLYEVITRITKEIHINTLAEKVGLAELLHKGGIKTTLSELIGNFVYLTVALVFLIMALQSLGVMAMSDMISTLVAYIPQVVLSVFVLVMGLILSKIVSTVIYAVATNLDMPSPKLLERFSHYAIVLYTAKIAIEELGFGEIFVGTVFHTWFAGVVLALALAYGIRGETPFGTKK